MTCEVGCCSPPHIARLGKDPRAASCSRVPKGPGGNSAFLAEHFENRVGFWGISPSYALVGEPETNSVVERLFRTPKEQIIRGRIFQTIDEAREAVRDFAARYNAEWLIEKNGYLSPLDARGAGLATNLRRTAQCNRVSWEPGLLQRRRRSTDHRGNRRGRHSIPNPFIQQVPDIHQTTRRLATLQEIAQT
jgi:hypothetical protein